MKLPHIINRQHSLLAIFLFALIFLCGCVPSFMATKLLKTALQPTNTSKDTTVAWKNEIKEYLQSHGGQRQERILTPADYYTTPQGAHAVRCQIIEKESTVLDLTLVAPGKEAAQAICSNWPKKSQEIYENLMGELI